MMTIVANYIMQTGKVSSCEEAVRLAREAIYGMKSETIGNYPHDNTNITITATKNKSNTKNTENEDNEDDSHKPLPIRDVRPLPASRHYTRRT